MRLGGGKVLRDFVCLSETPIFHLIMKSSLFLCSKLYLAPCLFVQHCKLTSLFALRKIISDFK